MPFVVLALVIAVVAFLLISRSRELFLIHLRNGKLLVVRGTVPQGLLSEFREAVRGAQNGKIRAARTPNGAQLTVSGDLDDGTEQRLRNILGLYPMSKLSAPEIDKRKAAHDVLTVAWFLSFFRRR